jgi:GH25 family lysozyme M1 (1,4-beta-N-acetylmuramidase)
MTLPLYIDISAANPSLSDWPAYKKWCSQWDGISRVAIKVTEGTGYVSAADHARQAQAVGIDSILWYHYARPDLNPTWQGAQNEVNFFRSHVPAIRASDYIMLDYEGFPGVPDGPWLPDWAWDWLHLAVEDMNIPASHVAIYSYGDFIARKLQYSPLASFPLIYAAYNAQKVETPVPAAPKPWSSFLAWQYSDHAQVPGVVGYVDVNQWHGIVTPPPPPIDVAGAIADLQAALKKLGA